MVLCNLCNLRIIIYSNVLKYVKRKAKILYFQECFTLNKNNPKNTWKTIKQIISSNHTHTTGFPSSINDRNGVLVTDKTKILNLFNNYFAEVGPNLAMNIQPCRLGSNGFKRFLKDPNDSSIFLDPTSVSEILGIISTLKVGKATGFDNISTFFIKPVADIISPILARFFNFSVEKGVFPDVLKTARVVPVFKSGNKDSISNFRPISILTKFSIIFEKLIYGRLTKFLDKHAIIKHNQFGFQREHSTSHAILDLVTYLNDRLEEKKTVCNIFLDLSKAFDTVDYSILLHKLNHYGIRGVALDLFKSYLSNRKQFVSDGSIYSSVVDMSIGVPQGSVLGPILFLLYINDIDNASDFKTRLFADDTCLSLSNFSLSDLETRCNIELVNVNEWMSCNRLTINPNKSKVLIVNRSRNKPNGLLNNFELNIGHSKLESADSVNYLGILIDSKLSWEPQVNRVLNKISKGAGILSKLRHFVPKSILRSVYFSLFYAHLNYVMGLLGKYY